MSQKKSMKPMSKNDQLSKEMQKVLGTDKKTIREVVEETPEVQEMLDSVINPEAMDTAINKGRGKTTGTTHKAIHERNERIISLSMAGLVPNTILKIINAEAVTKNWGYLANVNTINQIITKYYRSQMPSVQESDSFYEGLKEAAFSRLEELIEKVSMYILKRNKENNWKPFEFIATHEALFKMQQQMIENRNWNATRANPSIPVMKSTQLEIYDKYAPETSDNSCGMREIIRLLDRELESRNDEDMEL